MGTREFLTPEEIAANKHEVLPPDIDLKQNYPNPFNPRTTIRYQILSPGRVTLKVYTMLGSEVATLVDEVQEPGYKAVVWDASRMVSGVYLYKLITRDFVSVKKMIAVK